MARPTLANIIERWAQEKFGNKLCIDNYGGINFLIVNALFEGGISRIMLATVNEHTCEIYDIKRQQITISASNPRLFMILKQHINNELQYWNKAGMAVPKETNE